MNRFLFLLLPMVTASGICLGLSLKGVHKNPSNRVLGFFFFLFAMIFLSFLIVDANNLYVPESLKNLFSLLFFVFLLALPSSIYHYIFVLSFKKSRNEKLDLVKVYFFPLCLLMINGISFFFLSWNTGGEEGFIFQIVQEVMEYSNVVALVFFFPLLNVYFLYKSFERYKTHKVLISEMYSYEEEVNLKWIFTFISGYLISLVCMYMIQMSPLSNLYIPMSFFILPYLGFIGYKGYMQAKIGLEEDEMAYQPNLLEQKTQLQAGEPALSSPSMLYTNEQSEYLSFVDQEKIRAAREKSNKNDIEEEFALTLEIRQKIKKDLLDFMDTEKPYLNQKLLINQLARDINTNNKYLSYVINKEFDQNFVTFINTYRIAEAKRYMLAPEYENYKIEAIGNMAGFKSRSSFNNSFKNITGETPSAFRKGKMND